MLSISEIDAWDAGALDDLREQMSRRAESYTGLESALADASSIPTWIGEGADAAQLSFDNLSNEISDLSATVGALVEMLSSVADSVRTLQQVLDAARGVAESNDLEIVDPGHVQDGPTAAAKDAMLAVVSPTAAAVAKAARDAARAELQLQVDQIRSTATDLESDMNAVMNRAAAGGYSGGGLSPADAREKGQIEADRMIEAPPPPSDPNEMLLWGNTLSPDALADVREAHQDVDQRYERLHNQVDAFESVYGREPESSTDWIMADALDPTSYLDKNDGVDANIALGKIDPVPGQGVVRLNMYIPTDEVYNFEGNPKNYLDGHIFPRNLGDNRGATKSATAEESRVAIFVDYENGLIVGRQNPSVETSGYDETEAGTPEITARQGEDGSVRLEYMASDPFQPEVANMTETGVKGDLTIEPRGERRAGIGGNITNYPSVEAYQYRPSGDVDEMYNYGATERIIGPGFNLPRGDYKTLPDEVPSVGDNPELTVLPDGQMTIVPPDHPGALLTPEKPIDVPRVPTTGR